MESWLNSLESSDFPYKTKFNWQ